MPRDPNPRTQLSAGSQALKLHTQSEIFSSVVSFIGQILVPKRFVTKVGSPCKD